MQNPSVYRVVEVCTKDPESHCVAGLSPYKEALRDHCEELEGERQLQWRPQYIGIARTPDDKDRGICGVDLTCLGDKLCVLWWQS